MTESKQIKPTYCFEEMLELMPQLTYAELDVLEEVITDEWNLYSKEDKAGIEYLLQQCKQDLERRR